MCLLRTLMPFARNGKEPLQAWALILGCMLVSHSEFKTKEQKNKKQRILMHASHPKDSDLMSGVQPKLCNFLKSAPPQFEHHCHSQ